MEKLEKTLFNIFNFIKKNAGFSSLILTTFFTVIAFFITHFRTIYLKRHFSFFNISSTFTDQNFEFDLHLFLFLLLISAILWGVYFIRSLLFNFLKGNLMKKTSPLIFNSYAISYAIFFSFLILLFLLSFDQIVLNFSMPPIQNILVAIIVYFIIFYVFLLFLLRKNKQNKHKYLFYLLVHFLKYKFTLLIINVISLVLFIYITFPILSLSLTSIASIFPDLWVFLLIYILIIISDSIFFNYKKIKTLNFYSENHSVSKKSILNTLKTQINPNIDSIVSIKNSDFVKKKYLFKADNPKVELKIQAKYAYDIKLNQNFTLFFNFYKNKATSLSKDTQQYKIIPSLFVFVLFYITLLMIFSSVKAYQYEFVKFKESDYISVFTTKDKLILKKIISETTDKIIISKESLIVSPTHPDLVIIEIKEIFYEEIQMSPYNK